MLYSHPVFPAFVLTFGAFALLVFIACSTPLLTSFYFIRSSMAGGVRFGIWGWCLDEYGECSNPFQLGYSWDPQIPAKLTRTLVLSPIAAGLSFFALVALFPLLCEPRDLVYNRGVDVFSFFAMASCIVSAGAFIFMIALSDGAMKRFHNAGFTATFGPLPWMSLAATIALLLVTIISGCGTLCHRWRG